MNQLISHSPFSANVLILYFFFGTFILQVDILKADNKNTEGRSFMYDSDIGFGFGGKGILKNYYQKNESFDLVLFKSTKGQQWYKFTFSVPDFEIRQGQVYDWAFDFTVEYLKFINSNYFGLGNNTSDNNFHFTNENTKLSLSLSRAFTPTFIASLTYRCTFLNLYDFKTFPNLLNAKTRGAGRSQIGSVQIKIKYDSRDSQINPSKGYKIFLSSTLSDALLGSTWKFSKQSVEAALYKSFFRKHIIAFRLCVENTSGNPPIQALSTIGGSWTARGYKVDRFKDNSLSLISLEYRFPVYRQLGAVVFKDMGRVYSHIKMISISDWHLTTGLGLRYILNNFVVRMDVGNSKEGTRVFFNFGHVF
jgi:outer membrane protein assembly factor BamA